MDTRISKKKQQKNGFFYFMLDMQQDLKEQGRNVPMKDMPVFAGPSWSKLPDAQKQRYNMRAKAEKGKGATASAAAVATAGRRNCLGDVVSLHTEGNKEPRILTFKSVEHLGPQDFLNFVLVPAISMGIQPLSQEHHDEGAKLQEKLAKECADIRSMFLPHRRVTTQHFYLIHIQSLCQIQNKPDCKYLPCEIGVIRYCLSQGVVETFHAFIKPGTIPIGYRYLALSTSEATHQIPIEGSASAIKDYRALLGDLERFLTDRRHMDHDYPLPPVFTKRDYVDCAQWSLQWLADNAGVFNRIARVYEVENLIRELGAHISKNEISPFSIREHLNTSSHDHTNHTRCEYHEGLDSVHCSLGISHTFCAVMSELLCPMYSISLTPSHLAGSNDKVGSSGEKEYTVTHRDVRDHQSGGIRVEARAPPRMPPFGRGHHIY